MKNTPLSTSLFNSVVLATLALTLGACETTAPASSSTAAAPAPAPAPMAAPAPASAPTPVIVAIDFDKQVKPFFTEYCAGCHSGARARDGVHVESKAGLLANITPGDADHSRLFNAIGGPRKNMPPRNAAQPETDDIVIIKQWIDAGAKVPDSYPSGT